MDKRELSDMLDSEMTLEEIATAVDRHPSTVSYWMAKYGLTGVNAAKHRARGGIDREQLQRSIDQGMSITELAQEFNRSKATVRHWMKQYGMRTLRARARSNRRTELLLATVDATDAPNQLEMRCGRHGKTTFVREGRGSYRCRRCRVESVAEHRRRMKALLIAEAGGGCLLCGYDRSVGALQFHHLDPSAKEFALSRRGVTLSLEALRAEARKCVLLCANCHAEVERGVVTLPDTVRAASAD